MEEIVRVKKKASREVVVGLTQNSSKNIWFDYYIVILLLTQDEIFCCKLNIQFD